MPNWCENVLTVEGSPSDVLRFVSRAKGINPNYLCSKIETFSLASLSKDSLVSEVRSFPVNTGQLTDLSFHSFVPVPEAVQRTPFDSGAAAAVADILEDHDFASPVGGYEWQSENWDTKWGVDVAHKASYALDTLLEDFLVTEEGQEVTCVKYYFDSAWSPPIKVVEAIAKQFPESRVTLDYEERGMWFAGSIVFSEGVVESNREFDPEPWEEEET